MGDVEEGRRAVGEERPGELVHHQDQDVGAPRPETHPGPLPLAHPRAQSPSAARAAGSAGSPPKVSTPSSQASSAPEFSAR